EAAVLLRNAQGLPSDPTVDELAVEHSLDAGRLERWVSLLDGLDAIPPAVTATAQGSDSSTCVFADFENAQETPKGWFVDGEAFGGGRLPCRQRDQPGP